MPVAFVASNSVLNSVSGSSTAVPMPSGVASGHLVFVMVVSIGNSPVPSAPSGWTLVSSFSPGTTLTSYLYRKVAVSGDVGATHTWTWSSAGRNLGMAAAYSGVDTTISTNASAGWTHDVATGTTSAPALGAAAGDWLVTVGLGRENPGTATAKNWTIGTGTDAERLDIATGGVASDLKVSAAWFDSNQGVSAGSTARTVTVTPEMQQTHVWSVLLPVPASETAGGNPWTHMGRPLR